MRVAGNSVDDHRQRFEALVMPHLDAAYRFARWLSPSPSDADDIVQEAFLRAFRGFDGLRGDNVKAWLMTIVKNCYATARKQQQRHVHVPLPEESDAEDVPAMIATTPAPESSSVRRDEERTLDWLLSSLPEEHREVLVLREIEEMGYREIAAVTNIPIGTVMSRLARARAAIKARCLNQVLGAPRAVP
jgi:RNA polymerase sigma-70 factor (ECF subfamily)